MPFFSGVVLMRVLILSGFSESLIKFRGQLIEEMILLGHQVFVAAPDWDDGSDVWRTIVSMGGVPVKVEMSRTGMNPFSDIAAFCSILRAVWRIRPSVFLAYTIKPVIYGIFAAWVAGVEQRFALITGLGYGFIDSREGSRAVLRGLVSRMYRISLGKATMVFFQNRDDECLFRSAGILGASTPSRIVNGSGVDVRVFGASFPVVHQQRFLMIARLLGNKGVREYARAARLLKERYPSVECQLAGWIDDNPDSVQQDELDEWVCGGYIKFLGKLHDVRPALRECGVYVLPSYREGTPRTVLEAMAIGRTIVTSDAPGCRETVVVGENGFLVPVRDSDKLVEVMERFIERPELIERMGRRSREIAEEKYDVHKVNAVMLREMGLVQ